MGGGPNGLFEAVMFCPQVLRDACSAVKEIWVLSLRVASVTCLSHRHVTVQASTHLAQPSSRGTQHLGR